MGDTDVVPSGAYLARCVGSSMDLYARFCASYAPHHRGVPLVSGMGTAGTLPPRPPSRGVPPASDWPVEPLLDDR